MRTALRGMWLLTFVLSTAAAAGPTEDAWHRVVGILSYLEADYPLAVETQSAFELEEQRTFIQEALDAARQIGEPAAPFVARLESLKVRVDQGVDPEGVSRECGQLSKDIVLAAGLARSPSKPPDLARGEALFQSTCAACHGADGRADLPVAKTMEPPPANFHDPERMAEYTPYAAFNTISFGVKGTAMASYAGFPERDRWALAFYVFTLRHPPCEGTPPTASLEYLATHGDAQLAKDHGEAAVPCLRRKIPELDEEKYLLTARDGVMEAMRLAEAGDFGAARAEIVDAYLQGFEPVEPRLAGRDATLMRQVEQGFADLRLAAEQKRPLKDPGSDLIALIDRARGAQQGAQGTVTVFWLSLLILLREGFEVLVVLAALLAVLKKMDQQQHARLVHLGWMAAGAAGLLMFFLARHLISGAQREWIEGVVALVAVAMLLYAALWLNQRANVRKMMGELRQRVTTALGNDSRFGLFAISFFAMFRETFETALFLQGLAIDSPAGVAWGVVAGVALLVALIVVIRRVGYVLPMKTLFNVSTVVLVATAVILLGKGLHAMQEVGALPLRPLPFVTVDVLGIYPDAVSLIPQLVLALLPVVYVIVQRRRGDGAQVPTPTGA